MSLDVATLYSARDAKWYALHTRYLNEQLMRSSRRSASTSGFAGVMVIADARRGPAAALSLGRTLVDHVVKARATAREQASVIAIGDRQSEHVRDLFLSTDHRLLITVCTT
jgi:hypothetical protein